MKERFSRSPLYQFSICFHVHTGTNTSTRILVHNRMVGSVLCASPSPVSATGHTGILGLHIGSNLPELQLHCTKMLGLHSSLYQTPQPEEMLEEKEAKVEKGVIPQNISSSSPDEVVMPPSLSMTVNLCQFQTLLKGWLPLDTSWGGQKLDILHSAAYIQVDDKQEH